MNLEAIELVNSAAMWRDIEGYQGRYQVSDRGDVRSLPQAGYRTTGLVLKPLKHNRGYLGISLYKDGKLKRHYIHRLVASAFLTPEGGRSSVNHKDGDKTNNSVDNLEWVTDQENSWHGCHVIGTVKPPVSSTIKLTDEQVVAIRRRFEVGGITQSELAREYAVAAPTISLLVRGISWKHLL